MRELAHLLEELHDGLSAIETGHGVRLADVEMVLPVELRPVLRDGGCVLLAEFPRGELDTWMTTPSKLRIGWSAGGGAGT